MTISTTYCEFQQQKTRIVPPTLLVACGYKSANIKVISLIYILYLSFLPQKAVEKGVLQT